MTGVQLIAKERDEQIWIHNHTIQTDFNNNEKGVMLDAAVAIITDHQMYWPQDWRAEVFLHIRNKPRNEQLAIAGAFLAAEIDRNLYLENTIKEINE